MLTSIKHRAIPHDDLLPGLPIQLNGDKVKDILHSNWESLSVKVRTCDVEYVRYKPATNCLTAYRVGFTRTDSEARHELILFGKSLTNTDYRNTVDKLRAKHVEGRDEFPPTILLPDEQMIVDSMLNDPQLEGLRTIFDARKLRRIMYDVVSSYPKEEWRVSHKRLRTEVVRYKPEKRAVIKVSTTVTNVRADDKRDLTLYIRCYCDERGRQIHALTKELERLLNSKGSVRVPQTLAYLDDKRLLVMEGLDGIPLTELLDSKQADGYVARTASALWQLHCLDIQTLESRTGEDLYRDALATGDSLQRIMPEKNGEIEQILAILDSRRPTSDSFQGLVHGDFYYGQVLLQSRGEALLDFDRSYHGDTLFDLGNFCAHLHVLESLGSLSHSKSLCELFVNSYETASGKSVNRSALAYWTGFGLFLLAVRPFRTLQPDWPEKVTAILALSRDMLA